MYDCYFMTTWSQSLLEFHFANTLSYSITFYTQFSYIPVFLLYGMIMHVHYLMICNWLQQHCVQILLTVITIMLHSAEPNMLRVLQKKKQVKMVHRFEIKSDRFSIFKMRVWVRKEGA